MSEDEIRNSSFINGSNDEHAQDEKPSIRLKEPRDLYSTASLHHIPKWPIECQVIPDKIFHIDSVGKAEPFYTISYTEIQPKPVGEEMGTLIYNYQPRLSVDYFCRSCAGGNEDIYSFETDSNTLIFESRFESGNLAKVIKVTNVYYELYLRPDMYTERHSQWFYFRIQNTKDNITYRFSIVNLTKPDALYRYGLKPLLYSEKEAQLNSIGWIRSGQNISYYKNDITDENNVFYTLTFNIKFRHSSDTVYIAQCYPYTYTKLQQYLADVEIQLIMKKPENAIYLTNCWVRTDKVIVGPNCLSLLTRNIISRNKKPVVAISARVHPGESQSSYMMKGIIDFLTSNYSQAKDLRERFIFKLIPMLNPDGVVVGNSRCCLLGQDLNRQYRTVLREAFPQIYHTKVMLRRLMDENGIFLYCDLHGHSRRNNAFMYGCENKRVPEKKLSEQVFPLMMHKNASDKERLRDRILQKLLQGGSNADEPINISLTDYSSESEESGNEADTTPGENLTNSSTRGQLSTRASKINLKQGRLSTFRISRSVVSVNKQTSVGSSKTRQTSPTIDYGVAALETQRQKEKRAVKLTDEKGGKERQRSLRLKPTDFDAMMKTQPTINLNVVSTKCTNILFDDPFNPPAPDNLSIAVNKMMGEETHVDVLCGTGKGFSDVGILTTQRNLAKATSSINDIIQDFTFLQLSSKSRSPDQNQTLSPTASAPTNPKPRLKKQACTEFKLYSKSEAKSFVLQKKYRTIRRESFSVSVNHNDNSKNFSNSVPNKIVSSTKDHHYSVTHNNKSVMEKVCTRFQQRRVSWSGMLSHSSASFQDTRKGQIPKFGVNNSTGNICKKDNQQQIKNTIHKSKSMSDKLDGAAHDNITCSASIKNTVAATTTNCKKKKQKRQKGQKGLS